LCHVFKNIRRERKGDKSTEERARDENMKEIIPC
jgi:hypothetical protein